MPDDSPPCTMFAGESNLPRRPLPLTNRAAPGLVAIPINMPPLPLASGSQQIRVVALDRVSHVPDRRAPEPFGRVLVAGAQGSE